MKTRSEIMLKSCRVRTLAALALALALLGGSGTLLAQQDYVGAEYCANCHPLDPSEADNYADWRTSGHRIMLQ